MSRGARGRRPLVGASQEGGKYCGSSAASWRGTLNGSVPHGEKAGAACTRTGRRESGWGRCPRSVGHVLVGGRPEAAMWSWGRRSCSQWHVRRGGRPDAVMGMTSALAAAGTGRREGGGGDGDGSCTGGGRSRPKEEGSASRSCGGGGDGGVGRVDKEASCPGTEARDGLSVCIEGPWRHEALYYCRKPEAVDGRIGRPRNRPAL